MKVNVLGTEYTITEATQAEDSMLEKCDGYCDKTTKSIVIIADSVGSELGNYQVYKKKLLRHEIIHAFLFESGLHENWERNEWGHDETSVDWVAVQFPKLLEAFKEADAL